MKTDYQNEIIKRIRDLRNDNNLSQSGIAELLRISYGLVGNIESLKYKHKYTLKQIFYICENFKYPINELFLSEEESIENCNDYIKLLIKKISEYEQG